MGDMLAGRVAVVTGAGRGIGRGVALALAAAGAKVVVNDYGVAVDGSAPSSGPAFDVVQRDRGRRRRGRRQPGVGRPTTRAPGRIVDTAVERFGRIDILVTCAGILRDRMIFNMSEEEWDAVLAVHLKGTFNCVRHACTHMREQRYGRIVTFSSGSGLFGNPGPGQLRRRQGGHQRAHQGGGARPRPLRHHRQRDLPGRRHAHDRHRRLPAGARAAQAAGHPARGSRHRGDRAPRSRTTSRRWSSTWRASTRRT